MQRQSSFSREAVCLPVAQIDHEFSEERDVSPWRPPVRTRRAEIGCTNPLNIPRRLGDPVHLPRTPSTEIERADLLAQAASTRIPRQTVQPQELLFSKHRRYSLPTLRRLSTLSTLRGTRVIGSQDIIAYLSRQASLANILVAISANGPLDVGRTRKQTSLYLFGISDR